MVDVILRIGTIAVAFQQGEYKDFKQKRFDVIQTTCITLKCMSVHFLAQPWLQLEWFIKIFKVLTFICPFMADTTN